MRFNDEALAKCIFHVCKETCHQLINHQSQENGNKTEQNGKQHFISFSLLNALLPNIELKRGLFARIVVSKGNDVLHQSVVD
jgi:hypothetical protein